MSCRCDGKGEVHLLPFFSSVPLSPLSHPCQDCPITYHKCRDLKLYPTTRPLRILIKSGASASPQTRAMSDRWIPELESLPTPQTTPLNRRFTLVIELGALWWGLRWTWSGGGGGEGGLEGSWGMKVMGTEEKPWETQVFMGTFPDDSQRSWGEGRGAASIWWGRNCSPHSCFLCPSILLRR